MKIFAKNKGFHKKDKILAFNYEEFKIFEVYEFTSI